MSSDLATNQVSLLNSHPNPAHRKYERFACTIRIGLKYLNTSSISCAFPVRDEVLWPGRASHTQHQTMRRRRYLWSFR